MMLSASSLLAKVSRLKREALAAQPVDPLACLTGDQRRYFEKWVEKLHLQNTETADGAYSELLNMTHWTPVEWLSAPMVTHDMTEDQAGYLWNDHRDGVK